MMRAGVLRVLLLVAFWSIPTAPVWALSDGQTTTLTGRAIFGVDTLRYAEVRITLSGSSAFYTSSDVIPAATVVIWAGADGSWSKKIVGTDSLFCAGCGQGARYVVEIRHPVLTESGQVVRYGPLAIPANGSTTSLRSVLAAQ